MLPQSPFVALQHRNFRLPWTGQLISFSGSHMQTAALLWHVSLLVPAIGGLVIATLGVAWVYAVNALTFVCVIVALLKMRDMPPRGEGDTGDISVRAVREGFGFVFSSPIIRSTMLLDFFATFFSSATALLPNFAQDALHVGARGYGWL